MIDVRYIIVAVVMIATALAVKSKPGWATPLTLSLAAAALTYAMLFATNAPSTS